MTTHVYLKYAIALLMEEHGLQTEQDITFKEIKEELEKGLNALVLSPQVITMDRPRCNTILQRKRMMQKNTSF